MGSATGRSRAWRWIVGGLVILGLAGGAAYVLRERRGPAAAPPSTAQAAAPTPQIELAPEDMAAAVRTGLRQVARVSGSMNPVRQSVVKAEVAGTIAEVLVRRGEQVRQGQVLARLDTVMLKARLNERVANLEQVKAARAVLERSNANAQTLKQRGIVSDMASDQAQSNLNANAAQIAAIEAQVAQARKSLTDATIVAPIAGEVGERWVNPGENVNVDARLFSVVSLDEIEVEALVPAREVPRLAIGQQVRLRVEGFGNQVFVGRIDRINPTVATGTRAIPIFVILPNPDHRLKGGMFASGKVIISQVDEALAVPEKAIRREGGASVVYVLAGDMLARRPVDVGMTGTEDDMAEIRSGLKPGDQVLIAPFINLADGMKARLAQR